MSGWKDYNSTTPMDELAKRCGHLSPHFQLKNLKGIIDTFEEDTNRLLENGNLDANPIATTVHNLSRWMLSKMPAKTVFSMAYQTAVIAGKEDEVAGYAAVLDASHHTLTRPVLTAALRLSAWERRAYTGESAPKTTSNLTPNDTAFNLITQLTHRTVWFYQSKDIIDIQIPFTGKGTKDKLAGVVSFISRDTLWETVLKNVGTPDFSAKIGTAAYLIMLRHEKRYTEHNVTKVGLFNPRYNRSIVFDVDALDHAVYDQIVNAIYD